MMPPPPRLAERLIGVSVRHAEWRESILGDLREEFDAVSARRGAAVARRWYWRQALSIGSRSITAPSGRRPVVRRPWVAAIDDDNGRNRLRGLGRDVVFAWRSLARRPGTSAVIVGTLALTLAANSTIFALLDSIVLRPYRFPGVERLVLVASHGPQAPLFYQESVAPADFRDWRHEVRTVTHLSASAWWDANLSAVDVPEQVAGFKVTADYFDALGITPVLGRAFLHDEETPGRHRRVVLGYRLWHRQFAADPDIVGTSVRFDGEPYEVVGVAPPGFAIPLGAEVWAPLAHTPEEWDNRRGTGMTVIGRLAEGATIEQARAELTGIAERLQREYPETNGARRVTLVDFTTGMGDPGAGEFIGIVQAAALLLLLIACANIANLLLARGSERAQEYAVRLALGAGRGRLAWQTLLEGSLLTALSIALAVPLTAAGLGLSRSALPASIIRFVPGWEYLRLSTDLLMAMVAVGAIATVLFSLVPAWQAARAGLSETLRQGGRTLTAGRQRHWLRNTLATAQVALTLALLFGSALVIAAAGRAVDGAFGFDRHHVLTARLVLPERPYAEAERRRQFIEAVLEQMQAVPAVTGAAMVSNLPYQGSNVMRRFWPEGVNPLPQDVRSVDYRRATPEYFETIRIPLLAGRLFSAADRAGTQPVALVSQNLVDRYWPGADPLGRRFKLADDGPWITVVGVVGDVLHDWFQQRRAPTVYRPLAQDAPFAHAFVVRTAGEPEQVAGYLRRAIAAVDPDQPIVELKTMDAVVADRASGITFLGRAFGFVAFIAFVLATTGLYSLIAFVTSRRTQEIGVRIALGAGRWQVIRLTTGQAVRITIAGSLIGIALSIGLGRLMESLLFGIVTTNVAQLVLLVIVLATVALLAAYLPARRAAALDPNAALRAE